MTNLDELRAALAAALAEARRYGMSRAAQDRISGVNPILDALEAEREKRS